jgi:hypothetical protein
VILPLPLGLLLAGLLMPVDDAIPPHLFWAERLVADLRSDDNSYGSSPTVVQWRGVDGAMRTRNRSVCSSFITALFRRAYGYSLADVGRWLGRRTPQAIDYYQAIANTKRFRHIKSLERVRPGDLLATRQLSPSATSTGHLMMARRRPQLTAACRGDVCVYRLQVIDSSRSAHGADDSRRGGAGVGIGTIQLQADRQGSVLAYRWSERSRSRWRVASQEPLVVGRFCGQHCDLGEQRE